LSRNPGAPLLATPQFQEYPSAHSGVSSAVSSAVAQVVDARIFAGFHFRFACEDAVRMGREVGDYVNDTVARGVEGDDDD
jgi:hypothetical protein